MKPDITTPSHPAPDVRRRRAVLGLLATACVTPATRVRAQTQAGATTPVSPGPAATATGAGATGATWPVQPVRIVVPFAAGGGTDLIARTMAEAMARELGQPLLVDNKPGAGTVIGTDLVAKAAPDGYTLLMATFAHAVIPSLVPRLPFDTARAFAPVALVGRAPSLLVVRPDRPWRSVQDIAQAARATPGKLSYGSYGNGTSAHLAAELFKNLARVDITHVPYKGSAPALTDLLGGQIDLMFTTIPSVAQHVNAGRLRALAVTSASRNPAWAQLPTMVESGVPNCVAETWYGLYAPQGTPTAVIARLHAAAAQAVRGDAFRRRIEDEGMSIHQGPPEDLATYVRGEELRWKALIQQARISAD